MGRPANQGNAIAALIVSALMLCLCWLFALPAVILSIIGMVQVNSNPKASRGCTLAAWILVAVAAVAGILYWMWYGWALSPSSYDYYY
ncbi:hypothetical protein F4561_002392 [Lipingzhangella halophila]|uniref:DUF4190 domain-containing protein n=1 Tax=Lipingzhangella halophila TaxID=1783352 RepID=A0A7W7W226_9ACTN|nr:DUF4190 domain-containing protein [Lipingzhangella halophila]MBB4931572.1 hypothetical protein [Lipingzhangella halophila]